MHSFKAKIEIIGVNPFVFVPAGILEQLFKQAGREKGHIPVAGSVNEVPYRQTLVRYSGHWRLYINTSMLRHSPKRIGEDIEITIGIDTQSREIEPPEGFKKALENNKEAQKVFDRLPASRKLEIIRYLARLKTPESREKNIQRAIGYLLGKERFVGRDKP